MWPRARGPEVVIRRAQVVLLGVQVVHNGCMAWSMTVTILCIMDLRSHSGHFPAISNVTQSPSWSVFSLPALGSILFSSISHLHLNYICQYLYTCLYNVATLSSLYINLALLPHSLSFQYYLHCIILEDVLSSPMDTTPTRSNPLSGLQLSTIGSPLQGSG